MPRTAAPRYRYHWTHRSNLRSIARRGLDPAYADSRRAVVWTADERHILWAAAHVAHSHEQPIDELVLLRVRVDGLTMTRTPWRHVRTVATVIPPSRIVGVRLTPLARWTSIRRHRG